jgi:hypothetical protein
MPILNTFQYQWRHAFEQPETFPEPNLATTDAVGEVKNVRNIGLICNVRGPERLRHDRDGTCPRGIEDRLPRINQQSLSWRGLKAQDASVAQRAGLFIQFGPLTCAVIGSSACTAFSSYCFPFLQANPFFTCLKYLPGGRGVITANWAMRSGTGNVLYKCFLT